MNDNKRIAKNTLFLYARMILLLIISLYTSREVLSVLGETDYGVYNVVAGIVTLFTFFNNALTAGVQRYINFYLGRNDKEGLRKIFAQSFYVYLLVAVIITILCETVGLWLLEFYMSIPLDRMAAARVVYQVSIITTFVSILRIPFHATIIAYERMNFYAGVSILEGMLKLVSIFVLKVALVDKLQVHSWLYLLATSIVFVAYVSYCKLKFDIINFKRYRDKTTLKELMTFSGWSVVGSAAGVLIRQGNSILVNRYFGVTLNAALGIANQVNTTISQFLYNFQTAFNPHIIKTYAKDERDEVMKFTIRTSKFSFYLIYFIILPFMINIRFVLDVWLEEVPQYTEIFILFLMGIIIVDAFSGPLWTLVEAEGNIKTYQLVGTVAGFASFIAIFVAYVLGAPYYIGQLIHNLQLTGFAVWRIFYLKKRVGFPMGKYIRDVFGRSGLIMVLSIGAVGFIHRVIPGENAKFFGSCVVSCIVLAVLYLTIGVDREERQMVVDIARKKLLKK